MIRDVTLLVSVLVNAAIFISVVELIRRNRLKEKYALLWLFSLSVILWFSGSRESLHFVSGLFGIAYPPSFIFLLGFIFLVVINIHYSTVISRLTDKNRTLAQDLAILKEKLDRIDRET